MNTAKKNLKIKKLKNWRVTLLLICNQKAKNKYYINLGYCRNVCNYGRVKKKDS